MKIEIRISEPGPFVMKIRMAGLPLKVSEIQLPTWDIKEDEGFLLMWMMNEFKEYLNYMPFGDDDIFFDVGEKIMEKHGTDIRTFVGYLDTTSLMLENITEPIQGNGFLFVNASDDMRYKSLYSMINEQVPTLYLNFDLGFDREKREWIKRQEFMKPDEFIKYLTDNKIGTIVTVNHYLIDRYRFNYNVLLIPILKRLGVRLITIENDPPDLRSAGYLMRNAYNVPEWPAFSNLFCLTGWWDQRNRNCNINPIAIPQDYRGNTKNLRDDYRIVMLSNSRWQSVEGMKPMIKVLFENMENPWSDLTVWYMAMRRMILNADLTEYRRLLLNSRFHQFFWMAAQDIKYQVIKALKTDRPIDVYGDIGWKNVCPEYYRGSLNNEQIEKLFQRDDIVILLANCSFTYLDASGPVYDMIRRGCHWINLPVVAKTDLLKDMEAIEYSTPDELNRLVNDIKPAFKLSKNGLDYYRNILKCSVDELINRIKGNDSYSIWRRELVYHELQLEKIIDDYTDKHEIFMRSTIRMFKT